MKPIRVCIVGGGASGLACARVLSCGEYNCAPTLFEQNPFIGGQWHYDPYGTSETTAVYKNLRTNLSCSVMQYTDFPFTNREPDCHPDHQVIDDYLVAYAEKHELHKFILLNTKVNSIDETYTVTYTVKTDTNNERSTRPHQRLIKKDENYEVYSEEFDAVCVANGHFSEPYIPDDIPGFNTRTFEICHSRSYRDPENYRNKFIIVVGGSHSGVDISGELAPIARQVILSKKSENQADFERSLDLLKQSGKQRCIDYLSTTFSMASTIESIDKDTVYFDDKVSVKPDLIIFATGYEYRMPFLQGKLQIDQTRLMKHHYMYPLYKQLFHACFPNGTLSFLAMPYRIVPFPLAELQSHIVARVLCGKLALPSEENMLNEIDHLPLPQNRSYHCVDMIEYTTDLLNFMLTSNKYFDYKFSIDSQRRLRKIQQ